MPKTKLRPINETRRPNGQLTSETAARLHSSKGGKACQRKHRNDILPRLAIGRTNSIATRRAQALSKFTCGDCQSLRAWFTEQLSKLNGLYQEQLTILRKQIP